ncbi:P-loop containing nucleoside triphosphate hydrolase protein [Talaromyces proteolyticus]|uniref:P-loop containing nucleoside triphosphate hydrolase protein n=1 Tax=Talaromyces proteolyticus TaxID=1131652 RepID=A0AAD4PVW2_9EURO|nr:P-loop containing nucleoside triphosphate hydrolase protein [Talaromyces proteolyticus]KAH8691858.1 P-loop containing nucleoside triphosphate hydrolase protein [Talaromyces proteolyticus]
MPKSSNLEPSPRICASKLAYKTVNEIWDHKELIYKIFDSPPAQDVTELDEFVFVIRKRIDRNTSEVTDYIDIKSPGLRDILRMVLKDIRTAGLESEKPATEQNLLYHFLPDLKDYAGRNSENEVLTDTELHLNLLIQHLEDAYQSISDQLDSLLSHGKITWDLLSALFKPGTLVFMVCPSTGLPRCVRYNFGEEKRTVRNGPCFHINSQYFDFDGDAFGEFAVEYIEDIKFSDSAFDMLTIPEDKKKVIKSLTESRVSATNEAGFDDIIVGKGQGIIICLHGPPGTGKTLTAEAMAERLQRPLYSVSAGDLSTNAEELDVQLTRAFRIASDWKALERNRLVATFLRTMEYYNGIFFLTTNMLENFDEAILDRIQLNLRYDNLNPSARRKVFEHFLEEVKACVAETDIEIFAEIALNGRQIKNIVKIAYNVAMCENMTTRANHIRTALTANGHSIPTQVTRLSDDTLYD